MTIQMEFNDHAYRDYGQVDLDTVAKLSALCRTTIGDPSINRILKRPSRDKSIVIIPCLPKNNARLAKEIDDAMQAIEYKPRSNAYMFFETETGKHIR